MYGQTEIDSANVTGRSINRQAVVPRYVVATHRTGQTVLDFGAGRHAYHTRSMREHGIDVTAYDFGANVVPERHDVEALSREYDTVMASNVINVQTSMAMLDATLDQMAAAVKPGGRLVLNFPNTPRKLPGLTVALLQERLLQRFDVVRRVGGSPSAPILEATQHKRYRCLTQEHYRLLGATLRMNYAVLSFIADLDPGRYGDGVINSAQRAAVDGLRALDDLDQAIPSLAIIPQS